MYLNNQPFSCNSDISDGNFKTNDGNFRSF